MIPAWCLDRRSPAEPSVAARAGVRSSKTSPSSVAAVVGVALLISLLAAVLVSEALLRGIRVERLRDAPT
ncbi:hypothetical protein [Nonomuraea sp. NPDC050786]|uniref:hypothetical protein n=1 Tax=Nonomuraea sp. NPDC050786 TaxID=3154840 RepID=UPI0033CD2CFA